MIITKETTNEKIQAEFDSIKNTDNSTEYQKKYSEICEKYDICDDLELKNLFNLL